MKPGEFYLDIAAEQSNGVTGDVYLSAKYPDLIHTVEYSAYEELLTELSAARSYAKEFKAERDRLKEKLRVEMIGLEEENEMFKSENSNLQREIGRLKMENEAHDELIDFINRCRTWFVRYGDYGHEEECLRLIRKNSPRATKVQDSNEK